MRFCTELSTYLLMNYSNIFRIFSWFSISFVLSCCVSCPLFSEVSIQGDYKEIETFMRPNLVKEKNPQISLVGNGSFRVKADYSKVYLDITGEAKKLLDAVIKCDETLSHLIVKIHNAGIADSNISQDRFLDMPYVDTEEKENTKVFRVTKSVYVKVFSYTEQFALIELAETIKGVEIAGSQVGKSNNPAYQEKAVHAAFENLKKNKELYEQRLGIVLKLINFYPINSQNRNPNQFSRNRLNQSPVGENEISHEAFRQLPVGETDLPISKANLHQNSRVDQDTLLPILDYYFAHSGNDGNRAALLPGISDTSFSLIQDQDESEDDIVLLNPFEVLSSPTRGYFWRKREMDYSGTIGEITYSCTIDATYEIISE